VKKSFVIFLSFILSACQTLSSPVSIRENTDIPNTEILSAKCLAQLANSESRSIIAISPTLSASVDEEGDANVNLRMDLIDFHRAKLSRELTLANCKHDATIQLVRSVSKLTAGKIARNSNLAKAQKLDAGANGIKAQILSMKSEGQFSEAASEKLLKSVRNIRKQADRSEQRASGLVAINYDEIPDYADLESELISSLGNVQDHKRDGESYKNVRLNISGGIQYSEDESTSVTSEEDEVEAFGGVSLSVKLGIFYPEYQAQQARLHKAEFEQLYEPKTGLLWQLQNLHKTNLISETHLMDERSLILEEIASVQRQIRTQEKPERILNGKIAKLLLEAELIRVNINLKELRIILSKFEDSIKP